MHDSTTPEEPVKPKGGEPALLKMWLELQEDIEQLDKTTDADGNAGKLKARFTALTKQLLASQKEAAKEEAEDAPPSWAGGSTGAQNTDVAHVKQFLMRSGGE